MENCRHLPPPPTQTLAVDRMAKDDRAHLCTAAKSLRQFLKQSKALCSYFAVEVALLENLIYRNNNRFRNDKGFKDAKIVQKTLKRFLEVDLSRVVGQFESSFPLVADIKERMDGERWYLPTRQMSEFVLVRLHGCFCLMEKLVVSCRLAGDMARKRLKLGHLWGVALNNLGVISRIWNLSKSQMSLVQSLYLALRPIRHILPTAKTIFVEYEFPENLLEILSEHGLREEIEGVNHEAMPKLVRAFQEETVDELPYCEPVDKGVVIQRLEVSKTPKPPKRTSKAETPKVPGEHPGPGSSAVDLPCKAKQWRRICEAVDRLQTSSDIRDFADSETDARKRDRKSAVTKKLDQKQWKGLRARLKDQKASKKSAVRKLKEVIKLWILYPQSEGLPPKDWEKVRSLLNK